VCSSDLLGLVVLMYALVGLWVLRDLVFLWFGMATVATTLFFAAYLGWAPLLLWPGSLWLTRNAAPLMMLLLMTSGALFIHRSLDMPRHAPRASVAMLVVALAALASAVLFVAGVLDYGRASAVASVTGLLPGLVALSVAFRLARAGDRIAQLTFAGWAVYSCGVVTFALVQGGRIAYGPWSANALQACSILELLCWIMILTLRAERLRQQASITRRENERLRTIAQTDPLTGLLNRRGLEQSLRTRIDEVSGQRLAALYVIDLDGFKAVNDRHGHHAGDELLVQIAGRLRRVLRASDLVARTGGDEFIVVASELHGPHEAEQVGQKLLACTDAPFTLTDGVCSVGMTVGYALAPADGSEPDGLIKQADAAMYAGKQAGKRRLARALGGLAVS
jgi:diguanylate cyclase (GGDEF)-like protein